LTIAPLPWRSICRSSYFMQDHTPRKLMPMTRSHSSRVLSAVSAIRAITPAFIKGGIEPAELGDGAVHRRGDLGVIAHVASHRDCLVTRRDQLLSFRADHVLSKVRQDDVCACFRECLRYGESHAGRVSGDKRHFAGEV
jgi:hypothetical protein